MTLALGHKSVKDMLHSVSSEELGEWMVYEKYAGPVGQLYSDELLRQIFETLRWQSYLIGGQYKENPVPKPGKPYPTPSEWANMTEPRPEDEIIWEDG